MARITREDGGWDRCILCLDCRPDSWEHVLPKSIGGRFKAQMLCAKCNNVIAGSKIESSPSFLVTKKRSYFVYVFRGLNDVRPYPKTPFSSFLSSRPAASGFSERAYDFLRENILYSSSLGLPRFRGELMAAIVLVGGRQPEEMRN